MTKQANTTKKRPYAFYARLTTKNARFLDKMSKKLGVTKSSFINSHIAYLQNKTDIASMTTSFAKTRNKIQKSI